MHEYLYNDRIWTVIISYSQTNYYLGSNRSRILEKLFVNSELKLNENNNCAHTLMTNKSMPFQMNYNWCCVSKNCHNHLRF